MRIDTGQHLHLGQQQKLAPRMIQSMEILQMASVELLERIEQELTNNPTLELREPGQDDPEDAADERKQDERDNAEGERELVVQDEPEGQADDFERLTNLSEEYGDAWEANNYETGEGYHPARDTGERDGKLDAMANTAARGESLSEQLLAQWRMVETTPEIAAAGEYLINFIDDDGYIRTDIDTLARQSPRGMTAQVLSRALTLLQSSLEPTGLAARDIRECLLLQIDARARQADAPDLSLERLIVSDYLDDVEANRLPKIARGTGHDIEQIKRAIMNLRQFHPHPGRTLVDDHQHTISPDAIITHDEDADRYVATLTSGRVPSVQINRRYLRMLRDRSLDKQTREFVGQNLRSARWLIDAIQQRDSTLLRVINVVLDAQRDFFDSGPQALHPLPMTQVADQLGIHVATVSRAVREKYIQTPRGIYPLRMFFSGGTETDSGESKSWAAVQAKLEEIIEQEDKQNPLNDDELVEKLKQAGIDIARRTVAKYRKQLNIPPARQRKEF